MLINIGKFINFCIIILVCRDCFAADQVLTLIEPTNKCELKILTGLWENETVTWSGECVNKKAQGKCKVVWSGGREFTGECLNGLRHNGVMNWPNGQVYKGEFAFSMEGRGTLDDDGTHYEGDFKDGVRSGKGIKIWANGDRYEGDFLNGKYHGKGTYINVNCRCTYTGDFVNDDHNGFGKTSFENGDWYEGEYKNDKRNGKGTFFWAKKGEKFTGLFKDGKMIKDQGVFTDSNGNIVQGW